MSDFSISFQQRLARLRDNIQSSSSSTEAERNNLTHEINSIGQDFVTKFSGLRVEFDNIQSSQAYIHSQLEKAEARISVLVSERDQALLQVAEAKLRKQQSLERLKSTEYILKKKNLQLHETIRLHEEQMRTVRTPWLEHTSGDTTVHKVASLTPQDPFRSPSVSYEYVRDGFPLSATGSGSPVFNSDQNPGVFRSVTPVSGEAFLRSLESLTIESETPTKPGARRRGILPSGNASVQSYSDLAHDSVANGPVSLPRDTEPGSSEQCESKKLILVKARPPVGLSDTEEAGVKFAMMYQQVFDGLEKWCMTYASVPNRENEATIAQSHPDLWQFMMNCTYPGARHDSNAHVYALLQDSKVRYLFCMRMMLMYFTRDVIGLGEFDHFSAEVASTLRACRKALTERGLANEVRQGIIDRYSKTVEEIATHERFEAFRTLRLGVHVTRLRDMVGPLLNLHTVRVDAGKELGVIVKMVWDLTVATYSSYLSLQVYYPETSQKFNAASMVAKDQAHADPMTLQLSQLRLKLVITPVVTMRDDRGTTIRAKNLHKASVLTMA